MTIGAPASTRNRANLEAFGAFELYWIEIPVRRFCCLLATLSLSACLVPRAPVGASRGEALPPAASSDSRAETPADPVPPAAEAERQPPPATTAAPAPPSVAGAARAEAETPAESSRSAEASAPQALPSEATLRRLVPAAVQPLAPVSIAGRTVLVLQDLDRDGRAEVLVPAAAIAGTGVAAASLADAGSVFAEGRPRVRFYLMVLVPRGSGLAVASRVDLGERLAFGGLSVVPLAAKGGSGPLAVVASFHSRAGLEREWVVFSGPSLRPVSSLSLKDTITMRTRVEDIDGNGVIDIVVEDAAMEVGIGWETTLTWYRWSGTRFVEQATVSVVRSLNAFLAELRERMLARDWRRLAEHCFLREELRAHRALGSSDFQIVVRGLGLAFHYQAAHAEEVLSEVADVVLPQFQENPFSAADERGSYFLLAYRILEESGASEVIETPLYMLRNPFGDRKFFFRIR